MEIIKAVIPRDCVIFDMSDFHVGSPNCALDTLQEVVNKIKRSRNTYVIFKGDAIECITPGDKRYTHTCVMDEYKTPKHQADKVIEMFRPIKDRILAWGIGNHCLKLINIMDFGRFMADSLGVPYGAYVFKIHYSDPDGNFIFKSYHTHGWGNLSSNAKDDIQRDANRKAALKQKLVASAMSDCIYMSMGHNHQLIVVDPTIQNRLALTDDGVQIHQHYHTQSHQDASSISPDSRWYATTGRFRRLYSKPGVGATDYGEMSGYSPSEIGYAKITVKDGRITKVDKIVA